MSINEGEFEGKLLSVQLALAKNEWMHNAEQHYRIIRCIGDKSWCHLIEDTLKMAVEVQKFNEQYVKIEREKARYKTEINKLEYQIKKQAEYNEKLKSSKDRKDKNKKDRDEELYALLDIKRRSITTIENQIEKIQRLIGEKDDKFEFIKQQMNIINNRYHGRTHKTEPVSKKEKKEKENEYFMSQCKLILIQNILKHKSNLEMTIKLKNEKKLLKTRFKHSIKLRSCFTVPQCSRDITSRFLSTNYITNKEREGSL